LHDFVQFLALFSRFSTAPLRKPSILEIAGYPHYENVCSNILGFFIDPSAPHGLNTLLLKAMLGDNAGPHEFENVVVEREVVTPAGNRIDLLIKTEAHLIGVENKIFHDPVNPFDDYSKFLESEANGRSIVKIILAIKPTTEGTVFGFECLTYQELIDRVRSLIGHYAHLADLKYLVLLSDLMSSIENLSKGSSMYQQLIAFIADNESQVKRIIAVVTDLKAEMRQKVKELGSIINIEGISDIQQWYYREGSDLFDILVYDLKVSDLPIAIDVYVSPSGWKIEIFLRCGNRLDLKSLLDRIVIPYQEGDRFKYSTTFPYSEPLLNIQPHVQTIIDKLVKAR